jgi:hypothetical protein
MKVFLSYVQEDEHLAKSLLRQLRRGRHKVWTAHGEVEPGENVSLKIGQALEQADAMVILISPDAVKSEWVQREIDYALASSRLEGRVVIVEAKATKHMPWILKTLNPVEIQESPTQAGRLLLDRLRHLGKAPVNAS